MQKEGYIHNTDIKPSQEYCNLFESIGHLIDDEEIQIIFNEHDNKSIKLKKQYSAFGFVSYVMSALAITGVLIVLGLIASNEDIEIKKLIHIIDLIDTLAILSLLIVVWLFISRIKNKWLEERFAAEQIRHWHFQKFLDGKLIEELVRSKANRSSTLNKRLEGLKNDLKLKEGTLESYISKEYFDYYHIKTDYYSSDIFIEVAEIYKDLRLNVQLSYFKKKAESLKRIDNLSESIASWALGISFMVPIIEIYFVYFRNEINVLLLIIALGSALISLFTRVYRSAIGVSEELERYESKWTHLNQLSIEYNKTNNDKSKKELMHEVERIAISETKDFLRLSKKSSYIL